MKNKIKLYTPSHEWVDIDGDIATIGITDHAQEMLGDVVFVESVLASGSEIKIEETLAVVESVKSASDIFSPINGTIVEYNQELTDSPETVNQSPEAEGWICKIKISEVPEGLLDEASYKAQID